MQQGPETHTASSGDPALAEAWQRLADLSARPDGHRIRRLFDADPERARRFSASLDDLTLDFSKTSLIASKIVIVPSFS